MSARRNETWAAAVRVDAVGDSRESVPVAFFTNQPR